MVIFQLFFIYLVVCQSKSMSRFIAMGMDQNAASMIAEVNELLTDSFAIDEENEHNLDIDAPIFESIVDPLETGSPTMLLHKH